MAVSTERVASAGGLGVAIPGVDRLVWYFLRVSGVLLVLLAGGHMFITHYLNLPTDTTFAFVANRWANPLWRTFDWLLLISALWHGVYGLRYSITDYLRRPGWRVTGHSAIYVVGFLFTALGSVTIFTFNEEAARENTGPLAGELWIGDIIVWSLYAFAILTYVAVPVFLFWVLRSYRAGGPPVYAGDPGQYAWVFHRATGIGIVFFLLVHIIDIALIGLGRDIYDHTVEAYGNPFIIPMEIALVGAVIYHTLNGLRIVSIDFSRLGYKRERQSFYAVLVLTILLTLPSAVILILAEL